MDLDEMLKLASSDLERAESDFRAAQERVEAAQRHMNELRAMRDGALLLVERYGRAAPAVQMADTGAGHEVLSIKRQGSGSAPSEATPGEVPQTDRIEGLFRDAGTSLTTKQVDQKQADAGYGLSYDQTRSALGYLKRKGRLLRVGPATWRLPEESAVTDSTPTAGTAGVGRAGENGSSQGDVLIGAGLNSQPARQASF